MRSASAVMVGLIGVVLIGGVLGGCAEGTSAAGEPATGPETLELKVNNDQYAALDLDQNGASPGDLYVYSDNLLDDGGRMVGHDGGSCQITHVDGARITTQCLITMDLEQGSITAQSLWVRGTSPLDMVITGGTGAYQGVRGVVRYWDIATPDERMRAEIVR